MNADELRQAIANRLQELRKAKGASQGVGNKIPQQRMSDWEQPEKVPTQWINLRALAEWYEVSTDSILFSADDKRRKQEKKLTVDEKSMLTILKQLPEHKKEEVIRLAEVVLEMYRKEEKDKDGKSLFDEIKGKYESGDDDYPPRIIGEDPDDPQDTQ